MSNKKARIIAFYLPQFHPIPENNKWWGKGFTEWTNVGRAKPLFKGHYQPRVPADLGYYDLRVPEVREAQAEMARCAGIEGFMYWHYWFGNGKKLLETPFQEVLRSGKPDFPFCLGWANHSWEKKTWEPNERYKKNKLLIEQKYYGEKDYIEHFYYVLDAFKDKRYIQIDEKPLFYIFQTLPCSSEIKLFIEIWQKLAKTNGFTGIYFVGQVKRKEDCNKITDLGFDGICREGLLDVTDIIKGRYLNSFLNRIRKYFKYAPLNLYDYSDIVKFFNIPELDSKENVHPVIIPNYDHSPRSGRYWLIIKNSTPELFRIHIRNTLAHLREKEPEHKIVFLRSWNEWAEGNYIEPDLLFRDGYLKVLREEIDC